MGQLLVTLIVPPIVGLITYIVVRRIWARDENAPSEPVSRHEPSMTEARRDASALRDDVCGSRPACPLCVPKT